MARHKHEYKFFVPDVASEQILPLKDAGKKFGYGYDQFKEFARVGKKAVNGAIVRLEVCLMPLGLATTERAFQKFISELNGAA